MKDPTIGSANSNLKEDCASAVRAVVKGKLVTNYLDAVRVMARGGGNLFDVHEIEMKWAQWWLNNWEDDAIPKYKKA